MVNLLQLARVNGLSRRANLTSPLNFENPQTVALDSAINYSMRSSILDFCNVESFFSKAGAVARHS
jgi:hypothetical protein